MAHLFNDLFIKQVLIWFHNCNVSIMFKHAILDKYNDGPSYMIL